MEYLLASQEQDSDSRESDGQKHEKRRRPQTDFGEAVRRRAGAGGAFDAGDLGRAIDEVKTKAY
jgi:hypothetical protein